MKKLAMIAAACLFSACEAEAHYSVDVSSAPATMYSGQTASFQFLVNYSPMDLSGYVFSPNPSWAAFELSTAQLAIDITVLDGSGAVVFDDFFGATNANNKTAHPDAYASIPFDSANSFSTSVSRPISLASPGEYTINFSATSLERLLRLPTDACTADPICRSDFYADIGDTSEFRDSFEFSTSSITVSSAPEPETYAMVISGLIVVSVAARRSKAPTRLQ